MTSSVRVKIFKNYEVPKSPGIYYRLLFLSGEFKGNSYVLLGDRITMGRGDSCDIVLNESLASRDHAELKKISNQYYLTDLGSQNGTVINDLKISQQALREGDRIIIGKTVIRYNILEVNDKALLLADVTPKNSDKSKIVTKIDKKLENPSEVATKSNKKRIIIYAILLGLLALLFLDDGGKNTAKKNETGKTRDLIDDKIEYLLNKKNIDEDKEIEKKLNSIFQSGLREEREGNYYRAINEFNMALIISPGNARADFYLSKTKERLKKQVEESLVRAVQLKDALRYRGAASEYCFIIRLLQFEKENENYKKAEEAIKEIEKILGLDEGAIKCL